MHSPFGLVGHLAYHLLLKSFHAYLEPIHYRLHNNFRHISQSDQ